MIQHNMTKHNTTQHNTTQHNTAQRNITHKTNTTQHNTFSLFFWAGSALLLPFLPFASPFSFCRGGAEVVDMGLGSGYVFVRVLVSVYMFRYVCTYMCVLCVWFGTCICIDIYMRRWYLYTYIHTYIHVCVCVCVCDINSWWHSLWIINTDFLLARKKSLQLCGGHRYLQSQTHAQTY